MSTRACLLGLATLAACGGDDSSLEPDAATPPVDAELDTTPPQIESTTPSDGAKKVATLAPIKIVFDEPLDPSTVTAAQFAFGGYTPGVFSSMLAVSVPGWTWARSSVSYDATTRTVTLQPDRPLAFDGSYELEIGTGVKDVAGNAFAGATIRFRSVTSTMTKEVSYSSVTHAVAGWSSMPLDATGRQAQLVAFSGAGPDNMWMTSDDVALYHVDYFHDDDGNLVQLRKFDKGPDNIANTLDDPISQLQVYTYDALGRLASVATFNAPGPDAGWGTDDDVYLNYEVFRWSGHQLVENVLYQHPGADNVWRTADDRGQSYMTNEYDAQDNRVRNIVRLTGPDARPLTADDSINSYTEYRYENGFVTHEVYRSFVGNDGIWFTDDDGYNGYSKFTRNVKGSLLARTIYQQPGPNLMWFDDDDMTNLYDSREVDAKEQTTVATYPYSGNLGGKGADGMWGTPDDVIYDYVTTAYDADGDRLSERTYTPGNDGMAHTSDDPMVIERQFDITH